MSLNLLSSPDAVRAAMDEFDSLGEQEFLRRYGYGRSRSYFIVRDGKRYDSKAIAGVAVGKQFPERGPLKSEEFSGGELTVQTKLEQLGFRVISESAANSKPRAGFTSDDALLAITTAWGPPTVPPTKYLAVWRTSNGRELGLHLEQRSAKVWIEVAPTSIPGVSVRHEYGPRDTRNSNLKANAPRLSLPNVAWYMEVANTEALASLLDWYSSLPSMMLDNIELERLKAAFLREMPDFQSFADPGQTYIKHEREYKDELRTLFQAEVLPLVEAATRNSEGARALSQALYSVLTRKLKSSGKPQNLIGWKAFDHFKANDAHKAEVLGAALADLLNGTGEPIQRLDQFISSAGEELRKAGASGPKGIARFVGSCALMLKDAETFVAIRTDVFEKAVNALTDNRFPTYSDEPGRVRASMDLIQRLRAHLADVWNWRPQDLIDVQSFLWISQMYDGSAQETGDTFAELMVSFLNQFGLARTRPFGHVEELWTLMGRIKERLLAFPSVKARPDLLIEWSLGKGNWATIPWIALMAPRVTKNTREGIYCVFLVSSDLSRLHLALIQGTGALIDEHGTEANAMLKERAENLRGQLSDLGADGFTLSGSMELGAEGWRGRSYEAGTIAYLTFDAGALPSDDELEGHMERLLSAYERIASTETPKPDAVEVQIPTYTIDDAMDGVFMDRHTFERILAIWGSKKNLVLQGAPGVGKSFVARRLAYALLGQKDPSRVETVQFHQSYGYEDFVQGYRPVEGGAFALRDGVFFRFCRRALNDPGRRYVFVIDEINRGNLSKIFGELMLLIEHDKRGTEWAARLAYSSEDDAPFYVPDNLFIIGMMNTADRSLSLVDYALRRRFAFITLEPAFASLKFRDWLTAAGASEAVIKRIVSGMTELNTAIAEDKLNLGPGFCIGHSFFVPANGNTTEEWYERVVETEIRPLIEEYWFDDQPRAVAWCERLLQAQ